MIMKLNIYLKYSHKIISAAPTITSIPIISYVFFVIVLDILIGKV